MRTTLTLAGLRPGGYVGPGHVHPAVVDAARECVAGARDDGMVADAFISRAGSGLAVVLSHHLGSDAPDVDALCRRILARAGAAASGLGQHEAGDEAGRVQRADLVLVERQSEPVVCFFSSGTPVGVWNVPLYRMFADPFVARRLVDDDSMTAGFRFAGDDVFDLPADAYRYLRAADRGFVAREIVSRATGDAAAAASGGPDAVLVARCHGGFPSVGEVLEAFARPATGGAVLMPVPATDDGASTSLGPARVVAFGFQLSAGRLVGPRDLLGDRAFEDARREALALARAGVRVHTPRVLTANP